MLIRSQNLINSLSQAIQNVDGSPPCSRTNCLDDNNPKQESKHLLISLKRAVKNLTDHLLLILNRAAIVENLVFSVTPQNHIENL